jgi:hypothetical protein
MQNLLKAFLSRRPRLGRHAKCGRAWFIAALVLCPVVLPPNCLAEETNTSDATNIFPSVAEVIGGRTFDSSKDEDVFFLRAIHDRYGSYWPELLNANITVNDYVLSPDKMLRFVDELGEAMRDRNDPAACTNLASIVSDPAFYANGTVDHPDIIQAAAQALMKIGPDGRKALAAAFSVSHYRTDAASIEELADAVGENPAAGLEFTGALTAVAFDFSMTNGAFYPRCTTTVVKDLLRLGGGESAVGARLATNSVLDNPGRYQAIVDGIAAAQASGLATNLMAIQVCVRAKQADLAGSPGGYRDDLKELDVHIAQALANFRK